LRLNIEGEDRPGVWKALDFLKECNQRRNPDLGQEIIIVGGGDTAVDSARMARRVSPASRVTILYRRDRARMRARPGEIAAALEEGVRLELLSTPRELCFNGNGGLCALEIESTTLSDLDSSSGSLPVPVEGRFRKAPCDTLIVAIGEEPDPAVQNGLGFPGDTPLTRRSKGGLFPADPRDGATCIEGVFAGGDFVTGPSTVIEAIAAGRRGGYGIDRYLSGPGVSVPTIPVASRPTSIPHTISAPSRALDSMEDCMEEALACRSCGPCAQCRNCIDNLGCGAITIRDDRVVIDPQECTKCGLCVQLCPNGAIVERHRHLAEVEARSVHVQ